MKRRCPAMLTEIPMRCTRDVGHAQSFHRNGRYQWPVETHPFYAAKSHLILGAVRLSVVPTHASDFRGMPKLGDQT